MADELISNDGSVKRKKKPLLTIDSVLRNANEAKNDLKLAETFLSLRPMPDHDPRLVTLTAVSGHQSEDIIFNASNAITDSESPLPSTPESTDGSDSYHEIPSPDLLSYVPGEDNFARRNQIIDLTQHRMTSILSEEESSDEKDDVVFFKPIIQPSDETKKNQKQCISQNKCYRIPCSKKDNNLSHQTCDKCIESLDSIGVSFLKMINNNLKSELPFGPETNDIILNCTKCENLPKLFIKSKTVFRKLGHRGGEEEIPYLLCRECKRVCTSTEKILEAFKYMSTKFNESEFDSSLEGKQRFIYQGFDVDLYNRKINEAYDKKKLDSIAFWMGKQSFEVANAMFYLNIHYWKHFSSCFKYSKKRDLSRQTCRYRKPDWPTICSGFSNQIHDNLLC